MCFLQVFEVLNESYMLYYFKDKDNWRTHGTKNWQKCVDISDTGRIMTIISLLVFYSE